MNRIVLIGNGFDLAHHLRTKYEHFINWYWDYRVDGFVNNHTNKSTDLCMQHYLSKSDQRELPDKKKTIVPIELAQIGNDVIVPIEMAQIPNVLFATG
jgi:hypothetical protein